MRVHFLSFCSLFFIPLVFFLRLCRISVRCCLAQFLPSYFIFVGYRFLPSLFLPLFHSVSFLLRFPLGHFHFGPLPTSKYCLLPVAFFSWHLHPQAEVAFPSSPRPFAYCTPLHSRMMVEEEGIVGREGFYFCHEFNERFLSASLLLLLFVQNISGLQLTTHRPLPPPLCLVPRLLLAPYS